MKYSNSCADLCRSIIHSCSKEGNLYATRNRSDDYDIEKSHNRTNEIMQLNHVNEALTKHTNSSNRWKYDSNGDDVIHGRDSAEMYYLPDNNEIHTTCTTDAIRWESLLLVVLSVIFTIHVTPNCLAYLPPPVTVDAATTTTKVRIANTLSPSERVVVQGEFVRTDNDKNNNNNVNIPITTNRNDETISGFVAGAALTLTKTIVKYPMDTATVRLQMPNTTYTIYQPGRLFQNSYIGIISPLLSNVPAGAVFFAIKDAVSSTLKSVAIMTTITSTTSSNDIISLWLLPWNQVLLPFLKDVGSSRTFRTCIAVAVAQIPYWIVRNPSEVVKTKEQAGVAGFGLGLEHILTNKTSANVNGTSLYDRIAMYYTGYWENIVYAYPADVLKFVCYEQLSSRRLLGTIMENGAQNPLILGLETALYGAIATALAQYITTPLDVVRNRVMANVTTMYVTTNATNTPSLEVNTSDTKARTNVTSIKHVPVQISLPPLSSPSSSFLWTYVRSVIQLGQEEGWDGLFAGSIPRLVKAFISGAIQFATYEETKQALIAVLSQHK